VAETKDEPELISVASRAHTALHIAEPPEDPDKPGLSPVRQSLVLHGANHPQAQHGEMVTHNLIARIFRRWHEHLRSIKSPIANLVCEVPPDHQAAGLVFGFEPGLAALTATPELAATSDTPADDSPRSEPDVIPVKRSQKSASQTIADELTKDQKK
jgi:hypothetical protein